MNKLKLGGKSYAPGPEHPFFVYNKGLCEFVDLSDKLQASAVRIYDYDKRSCHIYV